MLIYKVYAKSPLSVLLILLTYMYVIFNDIQPSKDKGRLRDACASTSNNNSVSGADIKQEHGKIHIPCNFIC